MIKETAPIEFLYSAIILPEFNIFAIQIGDFGIRWYALSYIAGLLIGIYILRRETRLPKSLMTPDQIDHLFNYLLVGIIIGGRLGYILFYNAAFYLSNPLSIFRLWEGGMSFHGALIGVGLSLFVMARRNDLPFRALSDRVAMVAPIGLFLGRLSNFINGELYGRITTVPWAMIFPHSDLQPRHPSQLYEAGLEGALLGLVMYILLRKNWLDSLGRLTGVFLCGYGLARFLVETVRQPDAHIGLFAGGISIGQILSLPMILFGFYLLLQSWRQEQNHGKL
ncbi:prolipoprotein diacylglyceryl transferase [Candidatus Puniceispirillum sp.]|nr:prolipoprotein diacylglyceryl transferase [Candidatus Puniceispirillum sp.]